MPGSEIAKIVELADAPQIKYAYSARVDHIVACPSKQLSTYGTFRSRRLTIYPEKNPGSTLSRLRLHKRYDTMMQKLAVNQRGRN